MGDRIEQTNVHPDEPATSGSGKDDIDNVFRHPIFIFMFAVGLGIFLGVAIGYYASYNRAEEWAVNSVIKYVEALPMDCQLAINGTTYINPEMQQLMQKYNITTSQKNYSVVK
jgi:hypothetical protein